MFLRTKGEDGTRRNPMNNLSRVESGRYRPYTRYRGDSGAWFFLIPVLAVIVAVTHLVAWNATINEVTCTVNDKDRTTGYNASTKTWGSDMRIYTDNCGVLAVGDNPLTGYFTSADTYNQIKAGQTYTFKTIGYRLPIASLFPNIVAIEDAS